MTAREALRQLADEISEEDAALLLARAEGMNGVGPEGPCDQRELPGDERQKPLSAVFAEILSGLTDEEWDLFPSANQVDAVVYGTPNSR